MHRLDYTRYTQAVVYAFQQHQGQKRIEANGVVDYIVHPLRVTEHLRHIVGCQDVEILCAAVLHDTIEDSGTRYDEILDLFGDRVASIVAELTNDSRLPKKQRHEEMLDRLTEISPEAKLVKLADRYDNLLSIRELDPDKGQRFLTETSLMLQALRGACLALETAIEGLLASTRSPHLPQEKES